MPSSASASPATYTLSLHDALPIWCPCGWRRRPWLRQLSGAAPCRDSRWSTRSRHRASLPANTSGRWEIVLQCARDRRTLDSAARPRSEEHTSELQSLRQLVCRLLPPRPPRPTPFPYTTLFRSGAHAGGGVDHGSDNFRVLPHAEIVVGAPDHDIARPFRRIPAGVGKSSCNALEIGEHSIAPLGLDRKSTRLNSSHLGSSYAVFCLRVPRDLHPFPTRRSSDLVPMRVAASTMAPTTFGCCPMPR